MSKKKKISKTLVEKILDREKIEYDSLEFATEQQGDTFEISKDQANSDYPIYKTLVANGNETGPVVGAVPLDKHLDLKKLAIESGNKKVEMIPLKDLEKTSGFVHGANSPIGIRSQHDYPIFIAEEAQDEDKIIVSAGKIGRSVVINPHDLQRSVDAKFANISK